MLNTKGLNFLTNEQIKSSAPTVFTSKPSNEVSSHYTYIPTSKVIDDMRSLGWDVVEAKEVKARKGIGFQKHLLIFRNPDVVINGNDGDIVYPQILLTNSHDGKNAFTFTAGLFRLICENGLVIASEKFSELKIRHMGYSFDELQTNIQNIITQLPLTVESMNKMKQIELNEIQILEFANRALQFRFPEVKESEEDILNELVEPVRKQDSNNDVWSVFNRVQERLIKGNFMYVNTKGKVRKARKIKNFTQDIILNKQLFDLAIEYVS
jgi:hypothetical protein